METTRVQDRPENPTVNQLLQYCKEDASGVLERHFSGPIYLQTTWESLCKLSPEKVRLLSAVLLLMVVRSRLLFLMETSGYGIGLQTLAHLNNSWSGYGLISRLIDALIAVHDAEDLLLETI